MPKIFRNEEGQLVKEGSNGCTDCGLPVTNKTVLSKPVEEATAESTKQKSSAKKEVNKDDD